MTSPGPRKTSAPRLKVAIAHEWLVRYAGSERCVEEMAVAFPDAQIYTTLIRPDQLPASLRGAHPSHLQRIPRAVDHHEWMLPLMPLAWRLTPTLRDVDVVISSSHACAKAVRRESRIPNLCYCYTPMRYAWDFDAERHRFPTGVRVPARALMRGFRWWDRRSAENVTRFVAISTAVAGRIGNSYGREADVVHPPVRTDYFTPGETSRTDEYFLFVGRLVSYKVPDVVVEAFRGLPHKLIVVGEGQQREELEALAPGNVTFVGSVDDDRLRDLYRGARALVYPADEDFGIVMAEAQACGTPVVALRAGGATDILVEGETGWFVDEQTPSEVAQAVRRAASEELDARAIRANAERFSAERFRAAMIAQASAVLESQT